MCTWNSGAPLNSGARRCYEHPRAPDHSPLNGADDQGYPKVYASPAARRAAALPCAPHRVLGERSSSDGENPLPDLAGGVRFAAARPAADALPAPSGPLARSSGLYDRHECAGLGLPRPPDPRDGRRRNPGRGRSHGPIRSFRRLGPGDITVVPAAPAESGHEARRVGRILRRRVPEGSRHPAGRVPGSRVAPARPI